MLYEIAQSAPARDLARALNRHSHRSASESLAASLATFGAGVIVGAGIGMLFAPKSGRELRQELGDRVSEMRQEFTHPPEPSQH
jgi:hypothetical protein